MLLWHCCPWCSNVTLLEMLIWGQWDHVPNSWVSWVFFDTVAPDVQMRLCGKCWFEGNETIFFISESPDAFVTLLPLMSIWDFVGNDDLGLWDHVLYFWVSWCFCDAVAPDDQMGHYGKWWFGVIRPCSLFLSLLMLLWRCCPWWSNGALWEMLIWGQWDHILYFWVSWCFCDAVAPEDQMRLCGKCWFEGNETIFFISESPDAFVTLLHLMIKWGIMGNVNLRAMRPYSLFLSLLMLLWRCCTRRSNETLWEMLIWGQWVFVLNSWVSMLLWHCCPWCSNVTLLEMLIWGQWDHVPNSWVSWVFFDTVAPDVQMRLCGKCWFEGNETIFFISESPDAFVTLLPLMSIWDFVGNDDLGLWDHVLYFWVSWCFCDAVAPDDQMGHYGKWWFGVIRPCSLFLSLLMLLWHCCTWCSNETLWEMLIWWQWVFVLNSWVSWVFCDTVAPDVQMRLCGKWWFGVMRPYSLFLSLLMLLWHYCTWWSENGTLWEMLIWGQWDHILYFWVSWCFCDAVAPDVQMRLCGKC